MIDSIPPGISFPPAPPMMSMSDATYQTIGPAGPVIFFRDSYDYYHYPDMDQDEN
jgi:hypothetical protein